MSTLKMGSIARAMPVADSILIGLLMHPYYVPRVGESCHPQQQPEGPMLPPFSITSLMGLSHSHYVGQHFWNWGNGLPNFFSQRATRLLMTRFWGRRHDRCFSSYIEARHRPPNWIKYVNIKCWCLWFSGQLWCRRLLGSKMKCLSRILPHYWKILFLRLYFLSVSVKTQF